MTKTTDINGKFKNFYIKLYTSSSSRTKDEILSFSEGLALPTLEADQRERLLMPLLRPSQNHKIILKILWVSSELVKVRGPPPTSFCPKSLFQAGLFHMERWSLLHLSLWGTADGQECI